MTKKETTLDDLAAMVQRGFTDQAKRSDDLENSQKRLEESQNRLEDRQEKLEHRFAIVEFSIKDIRKEIANLTILIRKSSNEEEITQLKHRVALLETQLAK